jgi:hypothetical protein
MDIRTSEQERRASARRGPVNRTLCSEYRVLFGDHATHEQERRASARRGNETHSRQRPAFADGSRFVPQIRLPAPRLAYASRSYLKTRMLLVICVSYLRVRYSLHGWLTPAAPGARRSLAATCAICDPETHMQPRAAGVSPPWAGEPNAVPRISRTVHRPRDAQTRAAGVSPPWQRNAHATATGFRGWITFRAADSAPRTTAGSRQPLLLENADAVGDMRFVPPSTLLIARLAYASRSWSRDVCSAENTPFTLHIRTPDQERRTSAHRGPAKSHPHTRPLFVGRPPTVCVRIAVAFAFIGATGG